MFTRHKFLLVTVKGLLKWVLNYRSYPQIKLGIRFWTTLYIPWAQPICIAIGISDCVVDAYSVKLHVRHNIMLLNNI